VGMEGVSWGLLLSWCWYGRLGLGGGRGGRGLGWLLGACLKGVFEGVGWGRVVHCVDSVVFLCSAPVCSASLCFWVVLQDYW
jgi:hypothetical protein